MCSSSFDRKDGYNIQIRNVIILAHQTLAMDGGNLWDIFEQIFGKLKMGKPWAYRRKIEAAPASDVVIK